MRQKNCWAKRLKMWEIMISFFEPRRTKSDSHIDSYTHINVVQENENWLLNTGLFLMNEK